MSHARLNTPDIISGVEQELDNLEASVCVPMSTKNGLLGMLVLGAKKDKDYSQEDFEILETLANSSALAIQNLKLLESLRETKELESFYKVSSFVMHDLRNTISSLSMLSDNAQTHMADPEFQESMLKTLSASLDRMRGLLSKLSVGENHLNVAHGKLDVNDLIRKTLAELTPKYNIELEQDLVDLPIIVTDSTQLKKVIANLVLNGIEAMQDGGRLTIRTTHGDETAVPETLMSQWDDQDFITISVTDTGCGMTEEFINSKLFRPFQTTKDKGLGIGLYHCKEIIHSLGGRISVESTPGAGTTFYVVLSAESPRQNTTQEQLFENGFAV